MTSFDPTTASRAVLIEVLNVLGAFRDDIVLVGGWVPELLYPDRGHIIMRNYPPDIQALAAQVRPLLSKGLAREGYGILKAKFDALDSVGPAWAARVAAQHGEDYQQWQRSAFEFAQALFAATEASDSVEG